MLHGMFSDSAVALTIAAAGVRRAKRERDANEGSRAGEEPDDGTLVARRRSTLATVSHVQSTIFCGNSGKIRLRIGLYRWSRNLHPGAQRPSANAGVVPMQHLAARAPSCSNASPPERPGAPDRLYWRVPRASARPQSSPAGVCSTGQVSLPPRLQQPVAGLAEISGRQARGAGLVSPRASEVRFVRFVYGPGYVTANVGPVTLC